MLNLLYPFNQLLQQQFHFLYHLHSRFLVLVQPHLTQPWLLDVPLSISKLHYMIFLWIMVNIYFSLMVQGPLQLNNM